MGQLIFSPQAILDLQSIYRYIRKSSHLNAIRVRDKIINQSEELILNPTAGRVIIQNSKILYDKYSFTNTGFFINKTELISRLFQLIIVQDY